MTAAAVRRWITGALAVMGAATATAAALFGIAVWPGLQGPPSPAFPAPADAREAAAQDLQYLRQIAAYDRSFTPETRLEFERRIATLTARDLDRAALEMGVAWAFAAADNGHSNARSALRGRNVNALPLRVLWFSDGLYIVKAAADFADLVGARVIKIDDRPVAEIAATLRAYIGGRETLARLEATFPMVSPQALHAIGLAARPSELKLTFVGSGGKDGEKVIAAAGPIVTGDDDVSPLRDLSPLPWPGDTAPWRHVLKNAPLALSRPDEAYWRMRLPDKALYLQVNRMRSAGHPTLPNFLDETLAEIRATPPAAVIVDLRYNGGGNDILIDGFTRALPRALPQDRKIFVLTGPATFSAAIIAVARFRMFGLDRVHVVGDDVGDRTVYWGEGSTRQLPNSKIRVRYATALHRHDRACTVAEIGTCFWLTYLYPAVANSIDPDMPVQTTFAAYAADRDPVLEAALKAVRE